MQLDDLLAYRLAVSADKVSQHMAQIYEKQYHLARDEWRLLAMLGDMGSSSSLEAASSTTMDKVQVCRAANRLELKELLIRDVLEDDKRLRVFSLTAKGKALFEKMIPEIREQNAKLVQMLDAKEFEILGKALRKLARTED